MRSLVQETFSLHLLILRLCGLLPFKNRELFFRFYSILIYFTITVPLPILVVVFWITSETNLNDLSESVFLTFELLLFILKYLPFILNGPKISNLIYNLDNPIFNNNLKSRQTKIIDGCIKLCKIPLWFFLVCIVFSAIIFIATPFLKKSNTTPLEIWTPYDEKRNSVVFTLTFIYVVFATVTSATATAGYDILLAGLLCQLAAQVRILKDNLQYLDEDAEETLKEEPIKKHTILKKDDIIHHKIGECILHHLEIIKFVAKFERYFSFGIFIQFFGGCLVICVSIFSLTSIEEFSYTFAFLLVYTQTMLFEIFVYCYAGTTLYEESSSISTAIYMGNWRKYDAKSKKALMILMERANKPMIVTAGAILDLSFDTFTMILKRAYSFYAVLKQYK